MTDTPPAQRAAQHPAPRETPLRAVHESLGANLVDFAGWLMPLRYGSETAEHTAVRDRAGLFDLSHMGEISVAGSQAAAFLDYALVGHLSAVKPGRARYTMICDAAGGVLDDLIVYRLADTDYLVVANAANADVVHAALVERSASFDADVTDRSDEYALIALQGPKAVEILAPHTDATLDEIKYYAGYRQLVADRSVMLARTGYTGEDGFEVFCAPGDAEHIWSVLQAAGEPLGLIPAGLSARDTLRLEAGMPLYGNELSRDVTPFEAGLGRVVKFDKVGDFVGRDALLERSKEGARQQLVGLVARGRRVPRHGYGVLVDGAQAGEVTSGAPSPTLGKPIALAYVPADISPDAELAVDVRGRAEPADRVDLPFYQRAK